MGEPSGGGSLIPLLCFLLAVVFLLATRTVGRDMEKLRAWMRNEGRLT